MLFVGTEPRPQLYEQCPYTITRRIISPHFCLTPLAIFKWLEINCCTIILLVISPYVYTWPAYKYICATAIFCLIVTVLTLLVFFCQLNHGSLEFLPWRFIEVFFDILALIMFIFALTIGVYDCVQLLRGTQVHHAHKVYEMTDLTTRSVIMTVLLGVNCILYFFSASHANRAYL